MRRVLIIGALVGASMLNCSCQGEKAALATRKAKEKVMQFKESYGTRPAVVLLNKKEISVDFTEVPKTIAYADCMVIILLAFIFVFTMRFAFVPP